MNTLSWIPIPKTRLFHYIEIFTTKRKIFSLKKSDIFHIPAQNIDCGYSLEPPRPRRGGSNEYPQSMFLSGNKKNYVYPCKPQFYYIKVGFKGFWKAGFSKRNEFAAVWTKLLPFRIDPLSEGRRTWCAVEQIRSCLPWKKWQKNYTKCTLSS